MSEPLTMEARAFRSQDARQLLENPLFVEAFSSVEKHLQMAAMTCDSDDAQKALRIVISQQLLAAVKREITRAVQDGEIAKFQMHELEKKKKFAIFQR